MDYLSVTEIVVIGLQKLIKKKKTKVRIVKDQSIYNNADCVCALVCITLMYYIVSRSRGTIFAIQGALIP